jgi:hypothetical protein
VSTEANIYTVRPDGTALWLPEILASSLGIKKGDHLAPAQYDHQEIQGLIGRRLAAEKGRKSK